jgi:hypothetical protein
MTPSDIVEERGAIEESVVDSCRAVDLFREPDAIGKG